MIPTASISSTSVTTISPKNASPRKIVIIGNGPVGIHFCNELIRLGCTDDIRIFGEEPYNPYNRVALSQLLYGEKNLPDIQLNIQPGAHVETHWHTRITQINPARKLVTTQYDEHFSYDLLILATGSNAHIPNLPGIHLPGVFTFRNLKDAEALLTRRVTSRHTIILGGGLLGIETARAMRRLSTEVTLIHHSSWLMNRQLDEGCASRLQEALEQEGINVLLNTSVMAVDGRQKMEGVILRNGSTLRCDTLVLSTGIRPNIELAKQCGIAFSQGIRINEALETSVADIFAIGECAEINGQIVGLVAPGLSQASLLANRICTQTEATYKQQAVASKLKVLALPVLSLGEMGLQHESPESSVMRYAHKDTYRVLRFERGRLAGASAIGEWPDQDRLKDVIEQSRNLNILQKLRFKLTGTIWGESQCILDHHIICNCRQISAGQLRACAAQGKPLDSTGAGTVCGSCRPLLTQFISDNALFHDASETATGDKSLSYLSWLALLALALVIGFQFTATWLPPENYNPNSLSTWWTDSFKRQISGFVLLGLTVLSLLVSARKRLPWFKWISFSTWRAIHIALTTLVLAGVFFHTGVSDYQGINAWLISCFWVAAIAGVIVTLLSKQEISTPGMALRRAKQSAIMLHIVCIWPLPVLLGFHILSVYWF
jgi:nitrite reductase (NADH) large subunit